MFEKNRSGPFKVVTMGDSLTQGGVPPEHRHGNPTQYQWFMYNFLKEKGIEVDIWNLGIGGQTIGQIVARIEPALPADVVTVMGGTNDIWHFAAAMAGFENEIVDGIIEEHTRGINIIRSHPGCKNTHVILCSIPPMGNVKILTKAMLDAVNDANVKIESLCKQERVIFCDVNKAMRGDEVNKYARPELVGPDGVHFTEAGNKACGEAIARCVAATVKK
nr:SGNH/GDSL hydrolase family protein [Candidatus Sigynarchaeum springense]MDO8118896.1 SGNH/GDSL hydrolase family protein [Candidatus Sigynarchaeota archaeon]